MKQRSQTVRKKTFEKDNFTCQKCKIQDITSLTLEAHHIIPLYLEGENKLNNLITLCINCHHYAPDKKEQFEKYVKEEMTGTATILIKSIAKVRKEHPELFDQIQGLPPSNKQKT